MTEDSAQFPRVSFESWQKAAEKTLRGAGFEKLITQTLEGIAVRPLYTEEDRPAAPDAAGFAGAPPYRRGSLAVGRSGAHWDLRPCLEASAPEAFKEELRAELSRGARSLLVRFDREVRLGGAAPRSSMPPDARGLACSSSVQLGELLSAAPAELPIWLDAGGNALPVLACLLQARRARGLLDSSFRGGFGADPIGALAADGELPCSLEVALQQLIGLARFAIEHTPEARAITCSTLGYHDAGATAVQELAFAYATAVQYLRALCDGGLSVEQASQQLSFQVAIANDLFMEVAKLRALRQGFSQIVRTSGGSARAQHTLVHALTSARTKSTRDPWVNLLRETTESFAAAVGGADAITSFGFDRPFGESSSLARRLAFNLQAILDEEAHVTQAADPGGGSYYLEQLTDELGQKAWALFQRIEHAGGMAEALRSGLVGELIAERSRERAAQIAKRKRVIVGVSEFADVQEAAIERPPRSERVHQSSASPTEVAAKSALSGLAAARSDAPSPRWVLAAIEAAAAGASLSQLCSTLAGGSEPTTSRALPKLRDAEPFEALRARADGLAAHGARPSVFLCNLGSIPDHKARSQFATGYFAAGGFATLDNDGFTDADSAVAAFERSGSRIAVLCGSDETYASVVEAIAPRLGKRGALRIVLAGRPGDHELAYRAAGVTDFIFVGSELPALLKELLEVGP